MLRRTRFLSCLLVIGALWVVGASPIQAQEDCGLNCIYCSVYSWEGQKYNAQGPYDMACQWTGVGGGCEECESGPADDTDTEDALAIADAIESSSSAALRDIVNAHVGRLLLNRERGVLVVQGTNCTAEALGTVVVLTEMQTKTLADLRVRSLREFLATNPMKLAPDSEQ